MIRFATLGALIALWSLLACTTTTAQAPAAVQSLKILIAEPGIYRLTRAALRDAGLVGEGFDLTRLRLVHRSAEIPLEIQESSGDFSAYFYAEPSIGSYSSTDAYWLSLESSPASRIPARAVEPPRAESAAPSFTSTLTLDENRIYSANGYAGNHWFWQSLVAPVTRTLTATIDAPASASAEIAVSLAGGTDGQHWVQLMVNGQMAGEERWDGQSVQSVTAHVGNLRTGDNALALNMPGAEGQADVLFLDTVSINYLREFIAAGDVLAFEGGAQSVSVRGFSGELPEVYDVTDAEHPQRLVGVQTTLSGGAGVVSFYDREQGRRYIAFAPAAARAPAALLPARANTLRASGQRADYLIIAPAEFGDALQRLADHRSAHGLTARIVDVAQVYDAFSDGVADPHAIRDFLQYTLKSWAKPAPRFVVLVGKASYDYHDYLKGPNKNLVPTFLVPTPHLGEAASDDWYVAASEQDIRPQMAVGRIPAKSVSQLNTAIDKILAFETAPAAQDWSRRAVFVADDKAESFAASADVFAAELPTTMTTERIYLKDYGGDVNAARAPIIRQWNNGAGLITYVGHGSIDTWAAGPLFGTDYLGDITNGMRLPVLLTPTCLDGFFYHPQKDSLAESLLFKPDGGMIAGLVPTGLSLPEAQDVLTSELFAQLFEKNAPTLGEAVMRAKQQMPIDNDSMREVLATFEVLGDPALANPFRAP
jgi:Peptidase family C25